MFQARRVAAGHVKVAAPRRSGALYEVAGRMFSPRAVACALRSHVLASYYRSIEACEGSVSCKRRCRCIRMAIPVFPRLQHEEVMFQRHGAPSMPGTRHRHGPAPPSRTGATSAPPDSVEPAAERY